MKFQVRSESTRQFIIETTAELFNKKGFTGTSITDLEKITGLTKGSIYGNFKNKDEVALAAFDYNLNVKLNFLKDQSDKQVLYKDKLLTHVLLHYPGAKVPFTAGGCPIQNTAIEAAHTNSLMQKCAAAGLLKWTDLLVETIKIGISKNEFRKTVKPLDVALLIISLIQGGALFALSTGKLRYAKNLLETAKTVIEDICV